MTMSRGVRFKWTGPIVWLQTTTLPAGRDGYLSFKTVKNVGRYTDTYLDYAQSFVDYVQERGSVGNCQNLNIRRRLFLTRHNKQGREDAVYASPLARISYS